MTNEAELEQLRKENQYYRSFEFFREINNASLNIENKRLQDENILLKSKLDSVKETLLQIKNSSFYDICNMCDVELEKIEDLK